MLLINLPRQAYAERQILMEFENNNWAAVILNPLVKSGRADYGKRRRNAVHQLNKHQVSHGPGRIRIRFLSLGNGKEIGWLPIA